MLIQTTTPKLRDKYKEPQPTKAETHAQKHLQKPVLGLFYPIHHDVWLPRKKIIRHTKKQKNPP